GSPVAPGGNKPTLCRTKNTTDGLDPEKISKHVHVRDHLVVGRTSSAVIHADADFRISLARRSSTYSRLRLRISDWASVETPFCLPVSISACSIHRRSVSTATPNLGAVWRITEYRLGESSSSSRSQTMRTARSLND